MIPVPDHPTVDTPYGRRGTWWSCDRNTAGEGIHTGVDYAAPAGALVVAARPGDLVHANHGSAFGSHQVEVRCTDGTRDFYAHLRYRAAQGPVAAGGMVGEVGSEGNATGPHLHFERHTVRTGGWSCAVVTDPQPSIDWQEDDDMKEEDFERIRRIVRQETWEAPLEVTQPGTGDDVTKSTGQVLRELWQKVTKAT